MIEKQDLVFDLKLTGKNTKKAGFKAAIIMYIISGVY